MNHHAYLVEGDTRKLREIALHAAKTFGVSVAGNPDFHLRSFASLSIDDARALRAFASLRGTGEKKLFVISAASLTTDAQNALLKLFEEPTADTVFVLLVPHGAVLPTLRSRLQTLDVALKGYENEHAA